MSPTSSMPPSESAPKAPGKGVPARVILPKRTVQQSQAYIPPLEGRRSKVRLDFNENTVGFSHILSDDIDVTLLNTYPEYQAFLTQLAQHFGVETSQLMITNGSDEALAVLPNTFIEPGEDVALISKPTFALIPHYLELAGAKLIQVPVNANLAHDVAAIEQHLRIQTASGHPPKLAIFASPDNPTGALLPLDTLQHWCETYPNTLFVVDEAYAEYCGHSVLPYLKQRLAEGHENLLLTRTFSKAWALAGLRLGIVIGAPHILSAMTCVRSPYSVNTLAVAQATQLLPHAGQVQGQAAETMQRKASLIKALEERGYAIHPGSANFFLMKVGLEAKAMTAFCAQHGILLRDRSTVPELTGMVRISVGSEGENGLFLQTLDAFHQQQALLFDLDGTLVDTTQSFDATVAHLVAHFAPESPLQHGELDALRETGGFNDDWDATQHLLEKRGKTVAWEEISRLGTAHYLSIAPTHEHLLVELDWLKVLAKRYRLGIVTGRYRPEYDSVWAERLNPLFEVIICRDDVENSQGKPHPQLLQHAMAQLGCQGGYYVGNSVDDMAAARAAGLMAVGVTTTQPSERLMQAGGQHIVPAPAHLSSLFLPQ